MRTIESPKFQKRLAPIMLVASLVACRVPGVGGVHGHGNIGFNEGGLVVSAGGFVTDTHGFVGGFESGFGYGCVSWGSSKAQSPGTLNISIDHEWCP